MYCYIEIEYDIVIVLFPANANDNVFSSEIVSSKFKICHCLNVIFKIIIVFKFSINYLDRAGSTCERNSFYIDH